MLLTRRNLRNTRVDMMYCSENQDVQHATNALLANRAALTQNMNFVLLKTKVSQSTHFTVERIEKRTTKINGAKIDGTNA